MMTAIVGLMAAATAAAADPQCAKSDTVSMAPAVMLEKEDRFRDSLSAQDRQRLDAALPREASGRISQCAQKNGAACDAAAYMPALRETGLLPAFLASLCPK